MIRDVLAAFSELLYALSYPPAGKEAKVFHKSNPQILMNTLTKLTEEFTIYAAASCKSLKTSPPN